MSDFDRRESLRRFQQRCRERLAEMAAGMPQEQFDELIAGMRKRRDGNWYADKMLELRRAAGTGRTAR